MPLKKMCTQVYLESRRLPILGPLNVAQAESLNKGERASGLDLEDVVADDELIATS